MSIASRIDAIEEHLTQDYVMLEKLGFYNNENKNIQNISPILENFYNKVGNKTKIVKDGIVGETSQETTNGYQLINQPTTETSSTHNGLTYKSFPDGTLSIKGTATANQQYFLNCSTGAFQETSAYISLPAGTYTAKYIVISGTMTFNIRLRTGTTNIISAMQEGANTFTLSEDISNFNVYFYTSNNVARDIEFKMILEKGSTSHDWEKYTGGIPAPNPNFPMPVNTRTGELSYKISGKNLFDKNNVEVGKRIDSVGDLISAGGYNTSDYIKVEQNTNYVRSRAFTTNNCIALYDNNKEFISRITSGNTFTTTSTTYYVRTSIADEYLDTLQLEKGNEATTYNPYISRTFLINLGKNLFDKNNANILNQTYIGNTQLAKDSAAKTLYISIFGGKTYTISKIKSARFRIATTSSIPAQNVIVIDNSGSINDDTTYTITTSRDAKYLSVYYYNSSADTLTEQQILNSIQIEEGSQATPYSSYKTPIELCKIGTYQDYISKENGAWYKHNAIYKDTYNGSESYWYGASQSVSSYYKQVSYAKVTGASNFYSDKFSYLGDAQSTELGYAMSFNTSSQYNRYMYVQVPSTVVEVNNVEAFKTWLSSNNFSVYYPLATPTTTEITDTELISQLDAIEDFLTQYKINDEFILGYDEPSVEY